MPAETRYCPNCVSEMQIQKRKLGGVNKFYLCHSCGVRELQSDTQESLIIKTNKNKETNDYYGESEQDYLIRLVQQERTS